MWLDLRSKTTRETSETAVSWVTALVCGQAGLGGENQRKDPSFGAHLDQDPDPAAARQGLESRGRGPGGGDVSAGSPSGRMAVRRSRSRGGAWGRPTAEAVEDVARETAGVRDRPCVYRPSERTSQVDHR